jgi:hypothetical protein
MTDENASVQRLSDRAAIQDALARYARGVDRRNWDCLLSAFHPGTMVDQGDYKGSIEAMVESMKARHGGIEQAAHLITNCLIEFDSPDGAVVETYFLALLRSGGFPPEMRRALLGDKASAEGKIDLKSLGRYVDRFERRAGEWRIARRVCVAETVTGELAPAEKTFSANWVQATRDPDDPIWRMRTEFGLG